ncbi:LacI family DNA-binding transcriptional regulator [Marinomonas ostreistagni]|uniref:LacI family DNA-binding transcriptional regulator n=1 Tax=Marinomonas ostreistagni TaxID=359209 RepID=A0ABS0ZG58_9GAMM|nr:LacI family DNA-binding transcriptional regulator [Marinomonas ostreistagni]MBJ7552641.1 LacI family DNA-binding transcriptional regulator [Marinomonas ostreistagni]
MKKPSIKDVAKLAGVSTATVSNVFSGRKAVNDDLKDRVRGAAQQLGYQANRAASQLRSQRNQVVAVLVPNLTDTFFAKIISNLENMAFSHGYDVIVASSHDRLDVEESRINALLRWQPAGLIAIPCSGSIPKSIANLKDTTPVVMVDRVSVEDCLFDTVTIDNFKSGVDAGVFLSQQGHEKILIAASNLDHPPIKNRTQGCFETVEQLGGRCEVLALGSDLEEGANVLGSWLDNNEHPTAIFGLTNVTTLSVLTAMADRNIRVCDDISLVAHDDYAWMSARSTSLTVMQQPVDDIAKTAWNRLIARIESKEVNQEPQSSVLEAHLVKRKSVKKL